MESVVLCAGGRGRGGLMRRSGLLPLPQVGQMLGVQSEKQKNCDSGGQEGEESAIHNDEG